MLSSQASCIRALVGFLSTGGQPIPFGTPCLVLSIAVPTFCPGWCVVSALDFASVPSLFFHWTSFFANPAQGHPDLSRPARVFPTRSHRLAGYLNE